MKYWHFGQLVFPLPEAGPEGDEAGSFQVFVILFPYVYSLI